MNLKKETEIVMLPTTNEDRTKTNIYKFTRSPGNRFDNRKTGELIQTISPSKNEYMCQYLYFLSNEKPKDGDWYFNTWNNIIQQYTKQTKSVFETIKDISHLKKIIATTDKSIGVLKNQFASLAQHLPEPSPQFIQEYIEEWNKSNKLTKVMVDYEEVSCINSTHSLVEDWMFYLKLKVDKNNQITITKVKDSWTREELPTKELKELLTYIKADAINIIPKELINKLNKWIEQNL